MTSIRGILALRRLSVALSGVPFVRRACRKLRSRFLDTPIEVVITDFDGDLSFECRLDEHMSSYVFWERYYSRDLLQVLKRNLRPDSVFVDVGANQGEFTLYSAKRVPQGHVYAFEPVPQMFERLRRNLDRNGFKNVTAFMTGLSDRQATERIYTSELPFRDGSAHEGLFTLHPHGERRASIGEVSLERLDDLVSAGAVRPPSLMKIDVEGAELAVLRGAEAVLVKHSPALIVELSKDTLHAGRTSPEELIAFLDGLGYRIDLIGYMGRTKPLDRRRIPDYCNVFCSRGR